MLCESASKNQPQEISLTLGTPLGFGTSLGHLDTQDSPWPGLGGNHHLPYVVFSEARRGGYIQMAQILGTSEMESRNCPGWTPGTLDGHNSRL
jgi:hypothetical protein